MQPISNTSVSLALIFFYFLFPPGAFALQREFRSITVEDGLPHYTINKLLQDSEGYLWMATDDGLVRYDSHRFHVYKSLPTYSDSNVFARQALTLFEDSQQRLWVGTNNSLCLFHRRLNQFSATYLVNVNGDIVEKVPVTAICEYNDSTFLLGTDGGGLYAFNPHTGGYKQFHFQQNDQSAAKGLRIAQILVDGRERIWVASLSHGFLGFDLETGRLHSLNKGAFAAREIRALFELNDKELLLGTYGWGLWRYNRDTGQFYPDSLNAGRYGGDLQRIYSFHAQDSSLFIGTDGGGCLVYDFARHTTTSYRHYGYDPYSIANNVVKSILVDKDKNLWLGHFKGGVSFSGRRQPFFNIRHNPALAQSLSNNMVSAVLEDEGVVYIGTDGGGLNVMNTDGRIVKALEGTHEVYGQIRAKSILALLKLRNGDLLIGTYLDGVLRYQPHSGRVDTFLNSSTTKLRLSNDDVRCLFEDRQQRIWIGTNGGGVNVYSPADSSLTILQRDQNNVSGSLSLDWVRSITEDRYGFIWIATVYGLNMYDPVNQRFQKFFHDPTDDGSLSNEFVYSVEEDSQGNIWVGTSHGLNKYLRQEQRFISYTTADGLPDDIIYGMAEDGSGNLWITTNKGLSVLHKDSKRFVNYDVSDGLVSNSFINGALYMSKDTTLYMGTVRGLSYFKPDQIQARTQAATLVLTDFRLNNISVPVGQAVNNRVLLDRHISCTEHLSLSHEENSFSLEFALLDFSSLGKVGYAYKLEGFEEDWTFVSSEQSTAHYTELPPGTYLFRVKTTNMPSNLERSLPIRIRPSFLQSVWFKVLAILLTLGLLYYWNTIRMLKTERQKAMLQQQILEEKLGHEKAQADLRTQNLRYEMESKNAQLTSTTLLISHKNDFMREVKKKLETACSGNAQGLGQQTLQQLIASIDEEFKVEEDWQRFEEHFNHIHKDFFKKLKESDYELSATYLKLCAYLKMNLTSEEIASLMNISVRGVEKARSRLKVKLRLAEGENIMTFLSNL